MTDRKWWKEAVVYQVYPRSFMDTNGDGIGDLKGILSKLDYLCSLEIDMVWLNPIYSSPNDDNGYDVSDYENIMEEFGSMADFDLLLTEMHKRGLKLMMDLVVNHSSDEHYWFQQSRLSRQNPYRNYYHWWPAEKGKPAWRYSHFDVNSDAWKYDAQTDSYYLHYFSEKQPDLNWEYPPLREEIYKMMRYWLDKGVDGFRMDVIPFISKDISFPELPSKYNGDYVRYYAHGPHLHEYLKEMRREVLSKYPVITVAENVGIPAEEALDFVDPARGELDMMYHFEGVNMGYVPGKFKTMSPQGYDLIEFKNLYSRWDKAFEQRGWGTIYLGNHDQARMVSRWGNDSHEWRAICSKMLNCFLLSMRATPFVFQGDELGMSNPGFTSIDEYRDIETINMYQQVEGRGGDLKQFLEAQRLTGRDNSRTPFQWDSTAHAGFSAAEPWLRVNANYKEVNVEAEEADPGSCLHFFRNMIRLRKDRHVLVYGIYELLDASNPDTYAYKRTLDNEELIVLLNFRPAICEVKVGIDLSNATVLIGNYPDPSVSEKLRPYEAVILEIKR